MSSISDKEIIELLKKAETRRYGFNLLVREYSSRIYMLIRRMVIVHEDADDLTQEVFIKIWKNIDKFRGDAQLSTWIYRIALNKSLDFLKSKKIRLLLTFNTLDEYLSGSLEQGHYFSGDEAMLKLQKAIQTLPPKQKAVFNMRYFNDLTFDEISGITGVTAGALKASYHEAVKKIEKNLRED